MASAKLKALQAQIEADSIELNQQIRSEASRLGTTEISVAEDASEDDRRALLRKKQAAQGTTRTVPYKKIGIIVAATAGISVFLLLLLFWRGGSTDTMAADIAEEQQESVKYDMDDKGCPPKHAIPEYCRGSVRIKNVSVFDTCKELFETHGWDPAKLKACGLIQ